MDEAGLDAVLARGPNLRMLLRLSEPSMNSTHGYCLMMPLRRQLYLARMLAHIRQLDARRQRLVLVLCRRFLLPDNIPPWPARQLLLRADTSLSAVRLVACMPLAHQAVLLPTLAALASSGQAVLPPQGPLPWSEAADLVYGLSEEPRYARRVASAVAASEYRPYMRMLGLPALWYLVRYLREHNCNFALARITRHGAPFRRAVELGATTHLIAEGKPVPVQPHAGGCLHMAIYGMYMDGVANDLVRAMRYEPKAVAAIGVKWPQLAREVKWLRRRTFVLCAQAYRAGAATLWDGLAQKSDIVQCVVGYL